MSSTLTHAASASWIAVTSAQVCPHETSYIVAALISASILDVDHLVFMIRDRAMYRRLGYQGNLHHARSVFHEMIGLLLAGGVSGVLFLFDRKLAHVVFVAFAVHVIQDWVLGKSHPLNPVDLTAVQFFALTFRQKVVIDLLMLLMFGALWTLYLVGGQ
ncbi:MAG: hypothetical protein A2W37_07420 [Chloroflexi bacterium RBG_16_63_12]|jgi:hypothetical protein|nr:MAG: hypothetical protein A2W37_07420 [Chloroflexi bacterium RBG_16_63_12]